MRGIGQGRIGLDSVCFLVWLLAFLVKNDICIWEYQSAFFPIAIAEHGLHAALMGIVFSIPSLFSLRNSEEKLKLVNIAFLLPVVCLSVSLFSVPFFRPDFIPFRLLLHFLFCLFFCLNFCLRSFLCGKREGRGVMFSRLEQFEASQID